MKNLKYIMATLMVALIVAVVCVACNKDKETPVQEANNNSENEPNTEVVERKPIAVFDKNTGTMTSLIDIDTLNAKLNEVCATRGEANRYVFESIEVLDSVPFNNEIMAVIKVVILETETESSNSAWFANGFIEKFIENNVYYYSDQKLTNGEFKYLTKKAEGTELVTLSNGVIINSIPVADSLLSYSNRPPQYPWELECHRQNCGEGCQVSLDRPTYSYVCSRCNPDPESGEVSVCIPEPHPGRTLELFLVVLGFWLTGAPIFI